MAELRVNDFELYKKFLKAGRGVPYYKAYDEGGVEVTKIALRNIDKSISYVQRRIEELDKVANLFAPEEEPVVYLPKFNKEHWDLVSELSWRKVNDLQKNASKWSTEYLFRTLATVRNKVANKEFTKGYSFWAQGLVFKELHARTGLKSYWEQYLEMRDSWAAIQKSAKAAEEVEEPDELEENLPAYELPHYGPSEDEIISYLDR
jgi:hypothetical protein